MLLFRGKVPGKRNEARVAVDGGKRMQTRMEASDPADQGYRRGWTNA